MLTHISPGSTAGMSRSERRPSELRERVASAVVEVEAMADAVEVEATAVAAAVAVATAVVEVEAMEVVEAAGEVVAAATAVVVTGSKLSNGYRGRLIARLRCVS